MQLQQRLVLVTRLLLAVTAKNPVPLSQGVSVGRIRLSVRSIATTRVVTGNAGSLKASTDITIVPRREEGGEDKSTSESQERSKPWSRR